MNEAFLILNVAGAESWNAITGAGRVIPPTGRPTVLQCSRETVEAEAVRLQQEHPTARFVIFTATEATVSIDVPTHVNLKGEPLLTRRQAKLASLPGDVPF